jgi:predicted enzyme related to lactoylglutathione lyase
MAQPVVHFEIVAPDGEKLQKFYAQAFDWKVDADNPHNYGMVAAADDRSIGGGISAGQGDESYVTVYIEVDDLQAALDKVKDEGGDVVMEPMEIPGAVTMAQFKDPAGNLIGLVKGGGNVEQASAGDSEDDADS